METIPALQFYNAEDVLLCTLSVSPEPTWSLVWRLIWHVTSNAEALSASAYHELLLQEPEPNRLRFDRRPAPLSSAHWTQGHIDPGFGEPDPSVLREAGQWIVRRADGELLQVTSERPLLFRGAGSESTAKSSSDRAPGFGSASVKGLDGGCCFSARQRSAILEGMHIFPKVHSLKWERWEFGAECMAIADAPDAQLFHCANNMLTGRPDAHKLWDLYDLAVDPQDANRILCFEVPLEEAFVQPRSHLRVEHRKPCDRPLPLLLAHQLRQCFLKLIPFSGESSGPSQQGSSSSSRSTPATPQDAGSEPRSKSRKASGLLPTNTPRTRSQARREAGDLTTTNMLKSGTEDTRNRVIAWQSALATATAP